MIKSVKEQYDFLLDTDSLEELYPEMSGVWEQDKKKFIQEYEEMLLILESVSESQVKLDYDEFGLLDYLDEDF